MKLIDELIYQLNHYRGYSHYLSNLRVKNIKSSVELGESIPYHSFVDLGIKGLFDIAPIISEYKFPEVKGLNILDLGCASGFFSLFFSNKLANVTSIDINTKDAEEILLQKKKTNCKIIEGDIFDQNFDQEFDLIFCGSLLLHVLNPIKLLEIIFKALKPGGKLILCSASLKSRNNELRLYEKGLTRTDSSTDSAIWWISEKAMINLLSNIGFKNCEIKNTFILSSSRYACKLGYRCSLRHTVYNAVK